MSKYKELTESILKFSQTSGHGVREIMSDLLKYIIGNFNPSAQPDPTWTYDKSQNMKFHEMLYLYLLLMKEETDKKSWFDAWGDLFMSLTPKGGARGQFFTPVSVVELMTSVTNPQDAEATTRCKGFGERVVISDPSAGSGRNLLSAHARFIEQNKRKPYLVAEDIDIDCCRMCAVNMMVHGCFGEVICHDTLSEPNRVRVGFIINEGIYPLPFGFPTIRISYNKSDFVSLM